MKKMDNLAFNSAERFETTTCRYVSVEKAFDLLQKPGAKVTFGEDIIIIENENGKKGFFKGGEITKEKLEILNSKLDFQSILVNEQHELTLPQSKEEALQLLSIDQNLKGAEFIAEAQKSIEQLKAFTKANIEQVRSELKATFASAVKGIIDEMYVSSVIPDMEKMLNEVVDEIISSNNEGELGAVYALSEKYLDTFIHDIRVGIGNAEIAKTLGLPIQYQKEVMKGGILHDIGKILSDDINNPGLLTDNQFDIIKLHPIFGFMMLTNNQKIKASVSAEIAGGHHDMGVLGSYGVYTGNIKDLDQFITLLGEENIPESAKITHVYDIFDALISKRSYKKEFPLAEVMMMLKKNVAKWGGEYIYKALYENKVINILDQNESIFKVGDVFDLPFDLKEQLALDDNVKHYHLRVKEVSKTNFAKVVCEILSTVREEELKQGELQKSIRVKTVQEKPFIMLDFTKDLLPE